MVEGDNVFKEAISFLKSLKPLQPLEWDQNLFASAEEHVNDIGPKGLLLYQSSDGTEPEDRINKYCNYETLGENIDFGPNDAMGVIISLTLDDGEEQRPHRENLFKDDYNKVGIACGPHQTEFQMCVMDFAGDYNTPEGNNNVMVENKNKNMDIDIKMNKEDMMNNSNFANQNNQNPNPNNQSPLVKLSLENDDFKNKEIVNQQLVSNAVNPAVIQNNQALAGNNELDQIIQDTTNIMNNLKVKSKKVEIITKITYTYEDGSTKVVTQNESHEFKE
jgi:hypothetical protein